MPAPPSPILILLIASALEALLAYPAPLFRAIGHPVSWIGALISRLESALNRPELSFGKRRAAGILAVLALVAISLGIGIALEIFSDHLPVAGFIITALIVAMLLAGGNLDRHVREVASAMRAEGLAGGRRSVARIVGRDPETLDEAAVCRAAIESLAENASDGVAAPALWFLIGGLPGIISYKAINTADSMIGHKSDRYLAFGWAAARLDDLVNLPASRLTGLAFVAAAVLVPGASAKSSWQAYWRDAAKHRSPNAGWPEAAMAGALGLRLSGPRVYGGSLVADSWMGNGTAKATYEDIARALVIYRVAAALAVLSIGALGILIASIWS
jgi:adenosylcobinamide-phosphate synthase